MIDRPKPVQSTSGQETRVFKGEIFDVYQWQQELFDGSYATFERLSRADSAAVFPVRDDGKILLAHQKQPGRQPYISALGGQFNPNEDALSAAKRELLEESGLEARSWSVWYAEQPAAKIDWALYFFIAKGLYKRAEPALDAGERVNVMAVDFDEFVELATHPDFVELSVARRILEARLDPQKMAELRRLFMN